MFLSIFTLFLFCESDASYSALYSSPGCVKGSCNNFCMRENHCHMITIYLITLTSFFCLLLQKVNFRCTEEIIYVLCIFSTFITHLHMHKITWIGTGQVLVKDKLQIYQYEYISSWINLTFHFCLVFSHDNWDFGR